MASRITEFHSISMLYSSEFVLLSNTPVNKISEDSLDGITVWLRKNSVNRFIRLIGPKFQRIYWTKISVNRFLQLIRSNPLRPK